MLHVLTTSYDYGLISGKIKWMAECSHKLCSERLLRRTPDFKEIEENEKI
jgi:hypothetical protein